MTATIIQTPAPHILPIQEETKSTAGRHTPSPHRHHSAHHLPNRPPANPRQLVRPPTAYLLAHSCPSTVSLDSSQVLHPAASPHSTADTTQNTICLTAAPLTVTQAAAPSTVSQAVQIPASGNFTPPRQATPSVLSAVTAAPAHAAHAAAAAPAAPAAAVRPAAAESPSAAAWPCAAALQESGGSCSAC